MSNDIDRKALLARFIETLWNEGNIEAAGLYIAPSYRIHHDPGDPWDRQTLDLEGYKARLRASRDPFPDQRFDIQAMFDDGERSLAITWLWQGTHKGDFPGFPATGRAITMSGATVYYLDGERFTGHWQVTDRLGVYQQLR